VDRLFLFSDAIKAITTQSKPWDNPAQAEAPGMLKFAAD